MHFLQISSYRPRILSILVSIARVSKRLLEPVERSTLQENMFRRTDCHFYVTDEEFDQNADRYKPHATDPWMCN